MPYWEMNFPNNAKEKSREMSRIDDGLAILSSPGGLGLAAGPNIQHARGPHRTLRGPSCNLTWYSNEERGGTSAPYKSEAQVSPLYLRAGTPPESRDPRENTTPEEEKPPQDHSYETMEDGK